MNSNEISVEISDLWKKFGDFGIVITFSIIGVIVSFMLFKNTIE